MVEEGKDWRNTVIAELEGDFIGNLLYNLVVQPCMFPKAQNLKCKKIDSLSTKCTLVRAVISYTLELWLRHQPRSQNRFSFTIHQKCGSEKVRKLKISYFVFLCVRAEQGLKKYETMYKLFHN